MRWPGDGRVGLEAAGGGDGDCHAPAQRSPGEAGAEIGEQMIGGQAGVRRLVELAERVLGLECPADRLRRARVVDEAKGVDAVIGAVGETVGERRGGDMILIGAGFGMMREIGLHRGGIGLAGRGVGARRALERNESLGGRDGEDRGMVHRQAPYLARSEEHTSELQSLMRISYAVVCLKKKKQKYKI